MLTGQEVSMMEMMDRREMRVFQQKSLIDTFHKPVISFCLNIPGPIKTTPELQLLFADGLRNVKTSLSDNDIEILAENEIHEKTGDEALLSCNASALLLKNLMTDIEESHPLGRLFDIDVLDVNGEKLSRPFFRKCLICDRQAQECASSRSHTVREMQNKIEEMLASWTASGSRIFAQ